MDPPGILMLNSVRKVLELAGIEPESLQFRKDQFDATNIIDALTKDPKKCPVITAAEITNRVSHVMVTAGALKGSDFMPQNKLLADQWFIQCKNSYANNPMVPGMIQYCKNYQSLIYIILDFITKVRYFRYKK